MNGNDLATSEQSGLVVRSQVKPETEYGKYREHLRFDFWFSCNYCTTSEVEAGGQRFTIDHYEPKEHSPELECFYDNLMWSCGKCNEHKGDDRPTDAQRKAGHRYFRADRDRASEHFRLSGERIDGISNTGKFTEQLLYLNRLALRAMRKRRAELGEFNREIAEGLRALSGVKLDRIRPQVRAKFLRIKATLAQRLEANADALDDRALREVGRSVFVDKDPDLAEHSWDRREYLRSIGALAPPAPKPDKETSGRLL